MPCGIELNLFVFAISRGVRQPEHPTHFKLVGGVVVKLFGRFGDSIFDDGATGVFRVFGAVVEDVNALVRWGLGPVDGISGGGGDAAKIAAGLAVFGDERELAQHVHHGVGQRLEAKVGEPQAEVELIGHLSILCCRGAE